jgi:hypothetical protein
MGSERSRRRVGGRIRPADPGRVPGCDQREAERADRRLLGVVRGHGDRHDASLTVVAAPERVDGDENHDDRDHQRDSARDQAAPVEAARERGAEPVDAVAGRAGEAHGGERYPAAGAPRRERYVAGSTSSKLAD